MKKIISIMLSVCLVLVCFAGCALDAPRPTRPTEAPSTATEDTVPVDSTIPDATEALPMDETVPVEVDPYDLNNRGFDYWEGTWINYESIRMQNENFLISPMSLKLAMAMAAAGADNHTLDEILNLFGYESMDEYLAWNFAIFAYADKINSELESKTDEIDKLQDFTEEKQTADNTEINIGDSKTIDSESLSNSIIMDFISSSMNREFPVFEIANGIWHNSDMPGNFLDSYKDIAGSMNVTFNETPGTELKGEINTWVNDNTRGMIPELFETDLADQVNILVNALYMKSTWINQFNETLLADRDFTTSIGEVVKKDMMTQTDNFKYYTDDETDIVILPLDGGFYMAVVMGNDEHIVDKINKAENKKVHIEMPKFEMESSVDGIVDFLQYQGVLDAFDPNMADFSRMMDEPLYISNIIQSTKICVDEYGVEAAAATAVSMALGAVMEVEPPVDFIVDQPFSFYLYFDTSEAFDVSTPQLMFYGQYNK